MLEDLPTFYTTGILPVLDIFGLKLPTYYFIISMATCIGILWVYRRAAQFKISPAMAMDVCFVALVAGFTGARLFHVVYDMPNYYRENPQEIFYVWQGGFVFFGGLISGYFASFLFLRRYDTPIFLWHDVFAPVIALGYGVGRLSCFFHGCCYGKICPYPWAVPMVQTDLQTNLSTTIMRHPTPLYAMGWELLLLLFLIFLESSRKLQTGKLFFVWLGGHGIGRIAMELFRADYRGPQFGVLSVSMAISGILVALSLYMLCFYFPKQREPWFH